jgi:glyoxylase-like metal-dependent hydrolase (beta-lactamase superfamily II)
MNSRIHPVQINFKLPVNAEKKVDRVVFAYLVLGDQIGLIDTGAAGGVQNIVDALAAMGKSPADISMVINTHEHPDHIGGNTFFKEAANPVFACHADAVRWIATLDVQLKERPIYAFHTLAGQQGVPIEKKLQDGDVIDLGGDLSLEVIHCPGHSPGSISLFCPQEKTLIIGDVVQPVDGLPLYTNLAQTRETLKRLMSLQDVEKMYMAWVEKPYTGSDIKDVFTASLDYLDKLDSIVKTVARDLPDDTPIEQITRETLLQLNFDPPPVMAMTIASVQAHLA